MVLGAICMRRFDGKMNGEQYLADTSPGKREVHDLDPEMEECHIDDIVSAGNAEPFRSQSDANAAGFDDCRNSSDHVAPRVSERMKQIGGALINSHRMNAWRVP